jgi:hypothetical protein
MMILKSSMILTIIMNNFIVLYYCVCNIETFQVRNTQSIKNHTFWERSAFVHLEFMRTQDLIVNWYGVQRNLFNDVIRADRKESIDSQSFSLC